MGIFGKLFGSKKLIMTDPDFGEIESFIIRENHVCWKIKKRFLNSDIEILIEGNKDRISNSQKRILLNALNNEADIKSESEKALAEQYTNAEIEFESIHKHFKLKGITVTDVGFESSFQQKDDPNYFFNVHFKTINRLEFQLMDNQN